MHQSVDNDKVQIGGKIVVLMYFGAISIFGSAISDINVICIIFYLVNARIYAL